MKETYLSFAREILEKNVARIGPDGRFAPWKGEMGEFGETSAVIFALGLFFHLTGEQRIGAWDVEGIGDNGLQSGDPQMIFR